MWENLRLPSDREIPQEEWLSSFMCVPWEPSERDKQLNELANQYHERTEDYDRTVCTGPIINGEIRPVHPHERSLINQNAHRVHREIQKEARIQGFTSLELQKAISRWRGHGGVRP